MISLTGVSARAVIDRVRYTLADVSLEHRAGTLGVLGSRGDGTSLLLDVIDGTSLPTHGRAIVLDAAPPKRAAVARVSIDAPLPEALSVAEVCALESSIRGASGAAAPSAPERLAVLGVESLARRSVGSLSLQERRAVALALALTSAARVILVEEPLAEIDPVAARRVVDAIHARGATSTIVVTTASARDVVRLADRVGILTAGAYSPLDVDAGHLGGGSSFGEAGASMRIVVSPSAGKQGAAALVGVLGASDVVTHVELARFAPSSEAVAISVRGTSLFELARTVTRSVASTQVDVELVEPASLSLEAIRAAMAARAMSPPPGSIPPGRPSLPVPSVPPRRSGEPS